ncbi:unnamed protein product [Adineta steineri]|uniref:Vps16 C-terminal domain-containing protein n=1 Tax=Adineta steineri TaxID=433720 RepID=A0A818L9S9_9BILA|nr:unnamed protein product [Adineta steineri]
MEGETPKPMKKLHRNIFHKVGKKLEKFEQSLSVSSSHLHHGAGSSSDLSSNYHHTISENSEEQDDNISLQYTPQSHSDSPKAVLRHNKADRTYNPQESVSSENSRSSSQWHMNLEENADVFVKNSSSKYDAEMKTLCKNLMENQNVNLNECREYDKKISLLHIAVSFNTPKVTVPVILYLENTLSKPLFYELIKQYPSAINNYINIAKLRLENDYYIALLKQFNKHEDIAMIRLRQARETNNYDTKLTLLNHAAIDLSSHPWWHSQIREYHHLLTKQRELQSSLSTALSTVNLENRTVLETYKTIFDIDFRRQKYNRLTEKITAERSKEFETGFHLSPEMVMCARLSAIMHCGLRMHYDDFTHQAMHQNFFGKKYVIAPENFADMVYNWVRVSGEGQEKASEKAERFLNMIQNPMRRIYYAEKFLNYDVAMDTIANVLRDRVQLEQLRRRIPQDHPSFHRATALLENTKWKN